MKGLNFNKFYFGTVWWSLKHCFGVKFTLGGCGVLERSDLDEFRSASHSIQ